jgi:hypothetical protein
VITRATFALATLCAAAVLVVLAWPTLGSVVDDAWISARYARSLALGDGLVYDAGRPAVEGYTNLSWTLALALAHAVGAPIHATMVGLGLASGAASVVASGGLAAALARRSGTSARDGVPAVALLAPFGLALDPHLAVVSTNGLESAAFVAGVLGLAWAALAEDGRGSRAAGALLAALVVATRPEGAVVVAVLAALSLVRTEARPRSMQGWAIAAGGGITLAAIEIARLVQYGAWVPNTFSAKASRPLAERVAFDLAYLAPDAGFWWIALGIAVLGPLLAWRVGQRRGAVAIGALVVLLVAVAFSVDLWMPGGRLLLAPLALAWCLFVGTLARVEPRIVRVAAAVIALDLALLPMTPWARAVRAADEAHSAQPGNAAERAATIVGAQLAPGSWLVTRDAGVLAYFVGAHVHVAEIHPRALTQPHPGGRDLDPRDVVPARPELVVLTVTEPDADAPFYEMDRAVWTELDAPYVFLGRVRQHHQRYYDFWARRDLELPPLDEAIRVGPAHPPPY